MSIANELGEMFRRELQSQLVPLQQAVNRLEEGLEALDMLRSVTFRLAPLTSRLGALAGVRPAATTRQAAVLPAPAAKRGKPGRRPAAQVELPLVATRGAAKAPAAVARGAKTADGSRSCAIIGCKRPSRSKGYCSAHYQKLRLLMRTDRRPTAWVDDARPQSVQDVKLPRGRAASKALQEAQPVAATRGASRSKAAARGKKGRMA
ncbi:vegetative protein [Myxococcus qinghaiensis]|uniref:vegetative protein n=1 Tax=Myxococcus qinghaiensis TaxID=2906758 RepID=UPI0020A774C4|nr:vegetative protein [Myxococcus qinghaiensis]MCP3165738.1 vegetative protein [Myxococcus qinghaiensis]